MSPDQRMRRVLRTAMDTGSHVEIRYLDGLPERGLVTSLAGELFALDGESRSIADVRSVIFQR